MDGDVRDVIGRYPAAARPLGPPEPLGNAGGLSGSRLWRYRSGLGSLVVRAWPPGSRPADALERVHAWLREADRLGFVPVPLAGLDGRTCYERSGRLWELAPWMPGSAEAARPPSPARVRAGFAALAAFHQALAHHRTAGPSPGLDARRRELEGWIADGFAEVAGVLAARRGSDPLTAPAVRWLEAARANAPDVFESLTHAASVTVERQPCLRDARPDHLLFEGDAVTGLIDFGAMGVESVAADLARLSAEWLGADTGLRALALTAYGAVRPLDPAELPLIGVFERSAALLGGGHWVRWHFLEGRTFEEPGAVGRGLGRSLERMGYG